MLNIYHSKDSAVVRQSHKDKRLVMGNSRWIRGQFLFKASLSYFIKLLLINDLID